jgi:hypothetical protein
MVKLIRRTAAALAASAIVISVPSHPSAQAVPAIDKSITYILPQWIRFPTASDAEVLTQINELRSRIGPEGRRVKLGFTLYVSIEMAPVDPNDITAIRAQLASTLQQIDRAIASSEAAPVPFPICLSFVTAVRSRTDPLEDQAQLEDRRNIQWHSDPGASLASGWTTFSRYARKQQAIREAYIRELGRELAARMLAHPNIVVAASGDGEIELSYEKSLYGSGQNNPALLADYSPFAVLEFRDWLRGTGLYAPGQPFAGEAYRNSARYTAAASIATFNTDFGTNFQTWSLKYEPWALDDSPTADPRAIPASTYNQTGWTPTLDQAGGFDPPREHILGDPWSDVWDEFRQMMVWRYNLNFAKWMTTSPDPASGATVPADRWFTDQIMADYLFGNVAPNYDLRLHTSASPHWTADIRPYGSMGITSFNQNISGAMFKTLPAVAPAIAQRNVRWGIFEWNPSVPPHPDDSVYREEMAVVEQYKPSVLVPFLWDTTDARYQIEGTGFERELKQLVARLNVVPLVLSRTTLVAATTADGVHRTPPQVVRVGGVSGETPPWSITSVSPLFDVAVTADGRGFTVAPKAQPYALQPQQGTVVVSSSDPGYSPATLTVTLNVAPANGSAPPLGSFDTPGDGATVSGEVGVTGWAVDDIGVVGIDIYRSPLAGEPTGANGLVFLGAATLVPGARPDVQASYSVRPLAEQAGWGYMLLTNMLPGQGNGTFVLHAVARDVDGYSVTLGSRTIVAQNGGPAQFPFGTIDTPGQGQTVSGTIFNFGWAVSPNLIATDGSTIRVYIDNVFVGNPVYNQSRADIAGLFPGYPNTSGGNGAIGFFRIDTTAYANGVHTIAWVVTDSAGHASGIGSRYFTIANP